MEQYERQQRTRPAAARPPLRVYGYIIGCIMIGLAGGLLIAPSLPYPALWGLGLMVVGGLVLLVSAPLWRRPDAG